MKTDPERRLWYHAESESYVETQTSQEAEALIDSAQEDLLEVTGLGAHERAFVMQQYGEAGLLDGLET